jgi:hypothetical protein
VWIFDRLHTRKLQKRAAAARKAAEDAEAQTYAAWNRAEKLEGSGAALEVVTAARADERAKTKEATVLRAMADEARLVLQADISRRRRPQ